MGGFENVWVLEFRVFTRVLINPNSVFSKTQSKQENLSGSQNCLQILNPRHFAFNSLNQHDDNSLCSYTDNWSGSFDLLDLIYNL